VKKEQKKEQKKELTQDSLERSTMHTTQKSFPSPLARSLFGNQASKQSQQRRR
jgi:hypothetical protein